MNDQQRKQIGYLGEVHNLHVKIHKINHGKRNATGFSDTGEDLSKTFGISQKLDR